MDPSFHHEASRPDGRPLPQAYFEASNRLVAALHAIQPLVTEVRAAATPDGDDALRLRDGRMISIGPQADGSDDFLWIVVATEAGPKTRFPVNNRGADTLSIARAIAAD